MYERFTDSARKVFQLANQEAQRFDHEYIGTEHILLGLVKEGNGAAANLLKILDVDPRKIRFEVEKLIRAGPKTATMGKLPQTPRAKKVVEYAMEESRNLNHSYVGTEHILLGLLREDEGVAGHVLMNLGLRLEKVRGEILKLGPELRDRGADELRSASRVVRGPSKTPALDCFGRDLTYLASQGRLDPCIGRGAEIDRVIRILCRRQRNNPVLVGQTGVGKATIVDGLASRIAQRTVPEPLADRRILALDAATPVTGVTQRGMFEQRMTALTNEIRRAGNTVLLIDDIRVLLGGGSFDGSLEPSAMLRPAIARGELQFIGTGTPSELTKHLQTLAALELRLDIVEIAPPTPQAAVEMLKGVRHHFEEYHGVRILDDAIEVAVRLSSWYTQSRCLPDSAIDIIDEACTRSRLRAGGHAPASRDLLEKIERLQRDKEQAIADRDFDQAARLRDRADELKCEKNERIAEAQEIRKSQLRPVDAGAVLETLSELTGMSLEEIQRVQIDVPSQPAGHVVTALPSFERRQCESILQGNDVRIIRGTGFVLMPHNEEFRGIFDNIIAPAMRENGIDAMLAEDISKPGSILNQVWDAIRSSEVIVADVSGLNRNVIYELGLCFGIRRFPIILLRDPEELPFNLRMLRSIRYENTAAGGDALGKELSDTIEAFLAASRASFGID